MMKQFAEWVYHVVAGGVVTAFGVIAIATTIKAVDIALNWIFS